MPCYSPKRGWRSKELGANGRAGITFTRSLGFTDKPVEIACQQCIGCRLDRSADLGARCMHEVHMADWSEYVTFTYSDDFLPENGSLQYSDVQLFWKSLRKKFGKFRYFVGGEYGPSTRRPHYHAVIFDIEFKDKKFYKYNEFGDPLYTSVALDAVWKRGHATIGAVTFQSACYVAKYCIEKVTGDAADAHYSFLDADGRLVSVAPEFGHMSSKPGLGASFVEKYADQLLRDGGFVMNGKPMGLPRYYYDLLEKIDPVRVEELKSKSRDVMRRVQAGDDKFSSKDGLPRIFVRHAVAMARLKRKEVL